jgi:predicted lactoylglutathione lyase
MSNLNSQFVTIKLSEPTAFPDLNKKEGKEDDFLRDTIKVYRLKFKHFKNMQQGSDESQMMQLMIELTGLSERDIDELYAEDAAEITSVVFGFMEKYFTLAKKMGGGSA